MYKDYVYAVLLGNIFIFPERALRGGDTKRNYFPYSIHLQNENTLQIFQLIYLYPSYKNDFSLPSKYAETSSLILSSVINFFTF